MSLSSGLTLTDLSDYLAPSQLCIKPVTMVEDTSEPAPEEKPRDAAAAATDIMIDAETLAYYEAGNEKGTKGKKLKKAEITLNDCLACSGCITSAESVLVSMQSHEEVYRVLAERPDLTPILSIAPQSLASLAALHDLSLLETMRGLRLFFKLHLGFRLVFDTTFAREVSLEENRREFVERRSHAATSGTSPLVAAAELDINNPSTSPLGPLPILSSACPGWICYAEKTHGELLPFVSNVKSPQAVMGTIVKGGDVAAGLGLRPDQIYHVTVMPCYDKKLEASRPDFATPYASTSTAPAVEPVRDVDCVLTTGEVERMLNDRDLSLHSLAIALAPVDEFDVEGHNEATYVPSLLMSPSFGTSSGGYVHNALRAVITSLPTASLYQARLAEKRVRSDDYVEFSLHVGDEVEVKAAKCYGFRNLQNVVRKIGRDAGIAVTRGAAGKMVRRGAAPAKGKGRAEVEFIEVMACPSGCVNGGGQIAPPKESKGERRRRLTSGRVDEEGMPDVGDTVMEDEADTRVLTPKEWVAEVEKAYWSGRTSEVERDIEGVELERVHPSIRPYLPPSSVGSIVESVVAGLIGEGGDERRRELLRTSYRAVESEEVNGLAVKW